MHARSFLVEVNKAGWNSSYIGGVGVIGKLINSAGDRL